MIVVSEGVVMVDFPLGAYCGTEIVKLVPLEIEVLAEHIVKVVQLFVELLPERRQEPAKRLADKSVERQTVDLELP